MLKKDHMMKSDKSQLSSEHKQKSPTVHSLKPDNLNMSKSFASKDADTKDKHSKKIPKPKNTHK